MIQKAVLGGGLLLSLIIGIYLVWMALDETETDSQNNLIQGDAELSAAGFARVEGNRTWNFPADFGPHPEFQREQWILQVEDCRVDFTLIFDRLTLLPDTLSAERDSDWAMQSIMSAKLTQNNFDADALLTDADVSSRVALDLAGATEERVWVENWVLDWETQSVFARSDTMELDADLELDSLGQFDDRGGWYFLERTGHLAGRFRNADERAEFDCKVKLTQRFGNVTTS